MSTGTYIVTYAERIILSPRTSDIPRTENQQNSMQNKRQKINLISTELSVDNNLSSTVSNITTAPNSITTNGNTNWKEEFEQLREMLTKTIGKTVEEKMDSRINEKLQPLQEDVKKTIKSNEEMKNSIEGIKSDMEDSKKVMKEKIVATRASIENELSIVRTEMKMNENRLNKKLDNNNEKLDISNSKLDALINMFGLMTNNKNTIVDTEMSENTTIGQKRELALHEEYKNGGERNKELVTFEPEPGKISHLLHTLGWCTNKSNNNNLPTKSINTTTPMDINECKDDESYNGEYKQFKEGNLNKLKNI